MTAGKAGSMCTTTPIPPKDFREDQDLCQPVTEAPDRQRRGPAHRPSPRPRRLRPKTSRPPRGWPDATCRRYAWSRTPTAPMSISPRSSPNRGRRAGRPSSALPAGECATPGRRRLRGSAEHVRTMTPHHGALRGRDRRGPRSSDRWLWATGTSVGRVTIRGARPCQPPSRLVCCGSRRRGRACHHWPVGAAIGAGVGVDAALRPAAHDVAPRGRAPGGPGHVDRGAPRPRVAAHRGLLAAIESTVATPQPGQGKRGLSRGRIESGTRTRQGPVVFAQELDGRRRR